MPRKPRNSPRPPGRPRKTRPETVAAVAAGEMTTEDAAVADGVALSTMQEAAARARQASTAPAPPPSPYPAPPTPPAAAQAPPQAMGQDVASPDASRRSTLLALLAQALETDAALVAALPLDAAELGRRLADAGQDEPIPPEALEDPARLLRWVASFVVRDLRRMDQKAVTARKQAAAVLVTLASGQDRILRSRPVGETPEQIVQRRLVEVRDAAIERIGILTSEEAARLGTARAELSTWLTQNLGPVLGAEVGRRVDALFPEGPEAA